jgi:hypothetical protein
VQFSAAINERFTSGVDTYPNLLAHLCGWDAKLDDLEKRLRCSKCGKKSCHIRAIEMQKPRGTPPVH